MDVDLDVAYQAYLQRFDERFGEKAVGAFVKFDSTMVHSIGPMYHSAFPPASTSR